MTIETYSDLVAAFNVEFGRDETARIPTLIAQVEADLNANKNFRLQDMQKDATLTTVGGTDTVALPSDYLQLDQLFFNAGAPPLRYMPENQANSLYTAQQVARPEFYSILAGNRLKFTPTPDSAYSLTLRYKAKIPALTSLAPTNWLLTKNPNVYLHGCAFYFSPKIKDYRQVEMYRSFYDRTVTMLIDADNSYSYPNSEVASYVVDR